MFAVRKLAFFLLIILLSSMLLGACGEENTPRPANTGQASGATPDAAITGETSQTQASPIPGQPYPTPTPPGPDSRRVITMWTNGWKGNTDYERFVNDLIDQYRVRNPRVTLDWQDANDANYVTRIEEATKNPDNAPDIVLVKPGELYHLAALELLTDITTLGGTSLKDEYAAGPTEGLRYGSIYYGVPWVASTRVTLINRGLWQEAKLDPAKPPKNFAELDAAIPIMAKGTAADVLPVWVKPDALTDFMMEDGQVFSTTGDGRNRQAAFPSPVTTAKWQYYYDKRGSGVFDRDALTKDYADALKKYAAGKLVTVLDGAPLLPGLKNSNADLYKNTLVVQHVTGKAEALPIDLQGWAIPRTSRQPADALQFMRFLNSAENQLAFAKISGLVVPTNKKAHADTFVTAQDDTLAQARSIMVASLDKTRPAERLLPYPLKPDVRAKLFDSLNKAQATVWNREKRPQDALNEAAKAWNEVLKSL